MPQAFDATTGKWTRYADYGAWIGYSRTAEIDPVENKYVMIGDGDLRIWDLDDPTRQHTRPATTGTRSRIQSVAAPGRSKPPSTKR